MKKFGIVLVSSAILALLLCLLNATKSLGFASLGKSVCFFAFTYYVLEKYCKDSNTCMWSIVAVICVGTELPELPVRIFDFRGTCGSIPAAIVVMLSVVLSAICYREKKSIVVALTIVIMLLLCTLGLDAWEAFYNPRFL